MEQNLVQRTCTLRLCRAQHHYNCVLEARVPTQARLGFTCFLQVDPDLAADRVSLEQCDTGQALDGMGTSHTGRLPEWPLPLEHL